MILISQSWSALIRIMCFSCQVPDNPDDQFPFHQNPDDPDDQLHRIREESVHGMAYLWSLGCCVIATITNLPVV